MVLLGTTWTNTWPGGPIFTYILRIFECVLRVSFGPSYRSSRGRELWLRFMQGQWYYNTVYTRIITRDIRLHGESGTKCRAKLRYYNLARSILVLQFEVDQALHLARANLARHFT